MHTALAYELYTSVFELLRHPAPCENRLREACACASIHTSLQSAVEQAAFDVVRRLPKRSRRHFLAVASPSHSVA